MGEDRLTPQLGRIIDSAKAAACSAPAAEGASAQREGWAVLGQDGKVYADSSMGGALGVAQRAGTSPEAAAFALAGVSGDTSLPGAGWRNGVAGVDPHLPVAVKYLGRWVVVTLEEIPST